MQQQSLLDISLLIDSEYERDDADDLLGRLNNPSEERLRWLLYHLIGDYLRGECAGAGRCNSFMARFSQRLREEAPLRAGAKRPGACGSPTISQSVEARSSLAIGAKLACAVVLGLAAVSFVQAGKTGSNALSPPLGETSVLPSGLVREHRLVY